MKRIGIFLSIFIFITTIIYLFVLLVFKIYFTPLNSYYLSSEYPKELKLGNDLKGLSYFLTSYEKYIFTINQEQELLLYVDENIEDKNIKLLNIKIITNNNKVIYNKKYNDKSLSELKNESVESVIRNKNDELGSTSGNTYVLIKKNFKPSKYTYIDLEFLFEYNNIEVIQKERIYVKKYPAGVRIMGS